MSGTMRRLRPLGMVIDTAFTWGDDRSPNIPHHQTIIYEAHVKGLTMLHPEVPEERAARTSAWPRIRSSPI